jgi:hypothetical protein
MSNDLHDLFKKELEQIPLRPAETWVPQRRRGSVLPNPAWRTPLAIMAAVVVLVAALIGGRQLANFRDQTAATPGVVAGKAIYLSPSFNGSGWIQIDPQNLRDVSTKPLLDIPSSTTSSSETQVSADGSTIIVSDFSGSDVKRRVFDGRTGQLRGHFVPEVAMVLDHISADGTLGLGRIGDTRTPLTGESVIVTIPDGRVVRRLFAIDIPGEIQAAPVSPDLSTRYFVTTPTPLSLTSATPESLPYSLFVRSAQDHLSGPIPLPGITAGTVSTGPTTASPPLTIRPAIAFSADGNSLAALSTDGSTLDLVDTKTSAVTMVAVHKKTSFLDPFRPLVALAKTLNDEERRAMAFTPDGTALITWTTATHYDDINGAIRTTRGIQRIDVATGSITGETSAPEGVYGFAMSPDGLSIYVVVRAKEPPTPLYALRRLDAQSLELKAERGLADYAELQVLAAPSAALTMPTPTPPTRTQPAVGCTHDRLVYLVEQFFALYNKHASADLLGLFNIPVPAASGGFADYFDDPGVPVHAVNTRSLLSHWEQRFAAGDHFDTYTVTYPPEGATQATGNPTATFTRSFAGGTQKGNMQLDCSGGLLVAVRMSSDYAGWEWRDAFGVQFSVPSAWTGPEDIDTQKTGGSPRNWLVFSDASGSVQVSAWLIDDTAEHFAASRLTSQGSDRRSVTITDAGQSRDVIEVHAPATWSGPTGAGSYDNRHLVVQVTPTLAADVFVSAPRINGPSTVTPEQIQLQDRITVRLGAGTDLAAAQTHDVDGYTFTAQVLFDRAWDSAATPRAPLR